MYFLKANVITAAGNKNHGGHYRFDANSDHTHFLIFDEDSFKQENDDSKFQITYDQYRNKLESLFTWCLTTFKRKIGKCDL